MAGYGRNGMALLPLRYVANMFKEQTLKQLIANMQTQRVFPYEIYPGFHTENEYRRQRAHDDHSKGWFADGEGVRSFEGEVYEADETTGMVTMGFRFNDYMQYVDIGVMSGVKAEDVDRAKNVRFKARYINKWQPRSGKSHRPGIRPELNHLLTRLEGYVQSYYDAKLDFKILETFEGQPWSFDIL